MFWKHIWSLLSNLFPGHAIMHIAFSIKGCNHHSSLVPSSQHHCCRKCWDKASHKWCKNVAISQNEIYWQLRYLDSRTKSQTNKQKNSNKWNLYSTFKKLQQMKSLFDLAYLFTVRCGRAKSAGIVRRPFPVNVKTFKLGITPSEKTSCALRLL